MLIALSNLFRSITWCKWDSLCWSSWCIMKVIEYSEQLCRGCGVGSRQFNLLFSLLPGTSWSCSLHTGCNMHISFYHRYNLANILSIPQHLVIKSSSPKRYWYTQRLWVTVLLYFTVICFKCIERRQLSLWTVQWRRLIRMVVKEKQNSRICKERDGEYNTVH